MTINELFALVFTNHWRSPQYTKTGWDKEVKGYYTHNIGPVLGELPITSLTTKIVRNWHKTLEHKPTSANRSLDVLSKMFRWAEEEELVPFNSNPCALVKGFRDKKRSRYATEEELKCIGKTLDKYQSTHKRLVLFTRLLAMTGARPESLMTMKRQAGIVRFQGKTSSGTGEEESVIIPKVFLDHLPVREDGLLFGKVAYQRFWEMIRAEAGCSDLWLRDLRRTFATIGMSQGVGMDIIGELLNHRSTATTKTYAKLVPTARMQAALKISDRMSFLLGSR